MTLGHRFAALMAAVVLTGLPAYSQRPVYLSGRVLLDSGSPPLKRAAMQWRCGSLPITDGYTDSKGYFNLQLQPFIPREPQDASSLPPLPGTSDSVSTFADPGDVDNRLRARNFRNCQLGAQLAGYESQWIDLGRRRSLDNPDVGVILLHRAGAEGTDVSATGKAAPAEARKAYKTGVDLEKKGKLEQAQADFESAAVLYPNYAPAWNELGRVQAARGEWDAARSSFEHSIAADEKYILPLLHMSALEYRSRRWQQLADISDKALALDSFHYPQLFFWNAVAHYNLHHLEQAEERARRAEELDTGHEVVEASKLLGFVLAERRDFSAAADELRKYLKLAPSAPDADEVRSKLAQIEQELK